MKGKKNIKPSYQSKVFTNFLKLVNFKIIIENKLAKGIKRSMNKFVPKAIIHTYFTKIYTVFSKQVATFENRNKVTDNHIIYFHGGAYVFKAQMNNWALAKKIVDKSFCRMTLIDYPLAPENSYKETFKMVTEAYKILVKNYPKDKFILMGDSAGGGLALALSQKLKNENHHKPPIKNILLSPWIDITMSNPEIKQFENSDYILSVKMLKNAALKYSKGDDQKQYLLSPINGDFNELPQTIVFYGTKEIFYPDCKKLETIVNNSNSKFIFREYENMQHDWATFSLPERKMVIDEICDFIN